MTDSGPLAPKPHRWRQIVVSGVVLGLVLAGLVTLGIAVVEHHHHASTAAQHDPRSSTHGETASPATVPTRTDSTRAGKTGTGKPPRAGTAHGRFSAIGHAKAELLIPALHVDASIVRTGAVNGSMVIPTDVQQVGWYDGIDATNGAGSGSGVAPAPGQSGVAILAGHVDWVGQGPGALRYIGKLRPHDRIDVVGANGGVTHWRVVGEPSVTPKSALPLALFTNSGPARLALVTCGGSFDPATGNYSDNVIVWAALSSTG